MKRFLVFDFVCASAGVVAYFFLFSFLVDILGIPSWLVQIQLSANFLYALYGATLLATRIQQVRFFQFLVGMNFIYSTLCLMASLYLLSSSLFAGAALLFFEGLFIGVLATLESRSIVNSP